MGSIFQRDKIQNAYERKVEKGKHALFLLVVMREWKKPEHSN